MPRRKIPGPTEPLRVIKREEWEDESNYYVKEIYNYGGTNIDVHPKHPEIPKEKLLNEIVAPLLLEAWRRPSVQARIAASEREELQK